MLEPLPRSSGGRRRLLVVLLAAASAGATACRPSAPPASNEVSPDTWAVVNGEAITRGEVDTAFRRAQDLAQPLSEEEVLTAKLSLLEELIMNEILLARAASMKIELSDAELDTAYGEARKNISEDAFQQELTKRNLTAADMRDGLRRELLAQKVIDREVVSKITVSEQEITGFFNANRAQFNLPEDAYHIAQIVVTPTPDQQIANRTGDNATTAQAAASKIQMLMERLKGGATFGDLARDYSEDPESAPRGGDMGLVPLSALNQAPPALRDAVLNVTPGSARVVSLPGAHTIVYVVSREAAGQRDLSTPGVRDRISETLRGRKEQLLRAAYLTAARSEAEVANHLARRIVEGDGKLPAAGSPPASGG